jgi:hypothetical protein
MGFITRALVPRKVRRVMHPVRTAKSAVTPKPVKRVKRPTVTSWSDFPQLTWFHGDRTTIVLSSEMCLGRTRRPALIAESGPFAISDRRQDRLPTTSEARPLSERGEPIG